MTYIDDVFGPTGLFAREFPGYVPRPGQVKMANACHSTFEVRHNLLAEAPTGTGKSVAYGVPATWWAASENPERKAPARRTVIVTANIALQEQLTRKDLPLLQRLVPWKFTYALLKGRQNYLCRDKWDEAPLERGTLVDDLDRRRFAEIERWATTTTTGDFTELPFEITTKLRRLAVVAEDECTGKACPHHRECFSRLAREEAFRSDVIVTNYHMYFVHLALIMKTDGLVSLLPEHANIVFDEAHKAADIARDFFGARLSHGVIRQIARLLWAARTPKKQEIHIDRQLQEDLNNASASFFNALAAYAQSEAYKVRIREPNIVDFDRLDRLLERTDEAMKQFLATRYVEESRKTELGHAINRIDVVRTRVKSAMQLEHENDVHFIELNENRATLVTKPLDVGEILRPQLWQDKSLSIVATSATLTTGKDDFDFVARELGAEDADELIVPSPFDFERQAAIVVCDRLAEPSQPAFVKDVAKTMVELARLNDGSMLGLFTSHRSLECTYREFLEQGWEQEVRVMRQGMLPRTKLVEWLKEEKGRVLLGTESFWAGVDVPGDRLTLVVIDKIPFPSPDDPMLDAYEAIHGSRTFRDYSIPRATMALKQGVGRLIRTDTDTGTVVILDRRLVTKPYGKIFLRALPPAPLSRDPVGVIKAR